MHEDEPDWLQLRAYFTKWFKGTTARLEQTQPRMMGEQSLVEFVPSYCLASCQDYLESAFDSFEKGRFYAGLACVRPVAETAIILFWCLSSAADHQERLERWIKTSLKEDDKFLTAMSKTWLFREGDSGLTYALDSTRSMLAQVQHRKELPKPRQMLESIDQRLPGDIKDSDLYPMLYQYLCASSHAPFAPERHFRLEGDVAERIHRLTMPGVIPWVVLTSTFLLVFSIHGYLRWDVVDVTAEYAEAIGLANKQQLGES